MLCHTVCLCEKKNAQQLPFSVHTTNIYVYRRSSLSRFQMVVRRAFYFLSAFPLRFSNVMRSRHSTHLFLRSSVIPHSSAFAVILCFSMVCIWRAYAIPSSYRSYSILSSRFSCHARVLYVYTYVDMRCRCVLVAHRIYSGAAVSNVIFFAFLFLLLFGRLFFIQFFNVYVFIYKSQ